jgi:hypothetical protein
LVHFVFVWYIFSGFGIRHQEKSGNPAMHDHLRPFCGFEQAILLTYFAWINLANAVSEKYGCAAAAKLK